MAFDPRHKSRVLLDGPDRAAARSYFRAVGFTDEDLARPLVGVAHCWIEITPCNWNHRKLAEKVKRGHPRRRRHADRVQHDHRDRRHRHGHRGHEGLADQPRLDRGLRRAGRARPSPRRSRRASPAATRRSRPWSWPWPASTCPSVMLYGGSILYGEYKGKRMTMQDVFEAIGARNAGRIDDERAARDRVRARAPAQGACGGQFTANTMATAFEMLGVSPMGFNDVPAPDPQKEEIAFQTGRLVMDVLQQGTARRGRSSPASRSTTRSPASWPPAARPTRCCTSWPSRKRGRRQADHRRVRSDLAQDAAAGRHEAVGQLHRARDVRGRRHGAWWPSGCSTPACCIENEKTVTGRTIGEEARARARDAGPEGDPRRSTIRSSRRAASSSCAATSRPTAAWPRSPARNGTCTAAPRASSTARRTPSRR